MPSVPSFAQERFWFLDRLVPGNPAHTVQQSYVIEGELDRAALAGALRAVVARHDVLRRRYHSDGDELSLRTGADSVVLEEIDAPADEATRLILEDAYAPFDLVAGPLFRARLLTTGEHRQVLVLAGHRSVIDEPSMALIEKDLAAAYLGADLGPLPLPYAEFARAQREDPDAGLETWRRALAGAPAAVDLPTDRSRPPVPSYRAKHVELDASAAPTPVIALAAFAAVLGKYSRQDEVVVGVTSDGRARPELARVIGPLAGHLPARIDLSGDPTLAALTTRVGETLFAATTREEVPFDHLATELDGNRDLSRHPIFQVSFDYAPTIPEPALGDRPMRRLPEAVQWSRVDLELRLTESHGELRGRLVYAEDLFDEATVRRLARHYVAALEAITAEPGARLSEVDILAADERRLMFDTWNTVDAALPSDRTVSELFEEQVRATPDAVAVVFGADRLTYAELNARANRLAHYLVEQGVGPEVIVGLCLRRGMPLMIAALAIMKAGGAYLPLDPENPVARNEFLLTDAGTGLVVIQSELVPKLPAVPGVRFAVLEEILGELDTYPDADLPQRAGPDSMIYVIYTSGSTGKPKGVVMTHRPLTNLLGWQLRRTPVTGPTLQFSSIGFDISFEEMFSTWLAGGELVLLGEEDRRDPERMLAVMRAGNVRRLYCPPMVLDQLAHVAGDDLPPLAEIITAGEALQLTPDVRRLLARLGDVVVDNQYGPTEAHVITGHRMTGPSADWPTLPPVGAPVTNTRVYVLDEHLRPVPVGGNGEVCVGGVCLARGYLGRPELTEERFVPDPYSPVPGARMYRTGDLARWRPDGALVFLGRVDEQVKIRGYRVEPGEIETVLTEHPAIEEAAVLPVQRDGDRRLAAYLVVAPDTAPTPAELRSHLKRSLPEYMVPSWFVLVDAIPLTPVGKIDRTALPDPWTSTVDDVAHRPLSGVEESLARIWQDVIGLDAVGPDDNFFEIGGHSLLATKVVARIREELAVELSVRMLFEHSTIARLAAVLPERAALPEPAIPRRPDPHAAPLSPIQHGVWLLHQIHPDCVAYHMPICFELTGELDTEALDAAMTMLVARHEPLRTAFVVHNGQPIQRIADPAPVTVVAVDLRADPDALPGKLIEAVRTPFDLTSPPLWRAVRYVLGADRQALLLVVHHLVTDGWSMEVIKRDLSAAYAAARSGQAPDWPELPVQFADLAEWEAGPEADARMRNELEFWRRTLDPSLPPARLPTMVRRGSPGFDCESVRGSLGGQAVRELARQANVSPFSVLFSAFALVLARCSGQRELQLGAPLGVRDIPAADDLVGFFTQTLVLPCSVRDGSFRELVQATHARVVEALAHPHAPFEALVSNLAPRRDPDRNPFFDVWFNMLSIEARELSLAGLEVRRLRPPVAGALFDLGAYLEEDGDDLDVELVFRPTVFRADRVAALLEQFTGLVTAACADPDQPLDALQLPSVTGSDGGFAVAPEVSPVSRLRSIAAERPDRPALEGTGTISYAELSSRVDQVSRELAGVGAGPGHAVAITAERTPELAVNLLGTLGSGAAFCVLDASQPARRRADQLTQLRPRVGINAAGELVSVEAEPRLPAAAAYVAFTSGTTGRPLGVVGGMGPVTAFFDWYTTELGLGAGDRFSVLAGLSHDPLLRELLLPLWIGATACVPDQAALSTPDSTVRWLASSRITVVHLTPSRLRLLAAAAGGVTVPSARVVALGGAPVGPGDLALIRTLFPHARAISLYGATETPQGVSVVELAAEPAGGEPPLGSGSPSAELLVLRPGGAVAGVNEIGEVAVRSPHLAIGYLDEPDLTAARFIPDPLGQQGIGGYRTGDVGRFRPDGSVEFLGRLDDQLDIDGTRVEPAEVVRAALAHPGVADCVVLGHAGRLSLLVRPRGAGLTPDELTRHLADRLVPAMVPSTIALTDEIPLTPNGKPDRERALQLLVRPAEPTTSLSLVDEVAGMWRQVLGVPEVDPDAAFFDLGGTSIGLLQVHALVRDRFDHELSLADLFEHQTVRRLAATLAEEGLGPEPTPSARVRRQDVIDAARAARLWARALARGAEVP